MSEELEPTVMQSVVWRQDGHTVDSVVAKISGSKFDLDDVEAGRMKLDSEVVIVLRARVQRVSAQVEKKTGDIVRENIITVEEAHTVGDIQFQRELLSKLQFDVPGTYIPAAATEATAEPSASALEAGSTHESGSAPVETGAEADDPGEGTYE